ncbi:MAG: hypothetical protein ACRDNE_08330 [Gaiellaceae bacterium]
MPRLTFPLYLGGFLGPFGGAILIALIPNVSRGLDASVGLVAAAITWSFIGARAVMGAANAFLSPILLAALSEVVAPEILGFTAIGFVLVLVATKELGLGSSGRGLLVSGYGVGGILLGRYAGSVVDRAGRPSTALGGTLVCVPGVAGLFFAPRFGRYPR